MLTTRQGHIANKRAFVTYLIGSWLPKLNANINIATFQVMQDKFVKLYYNQTISPLDITVSSNTVAVTALYKEDLRI